MLDERLSKMTDEIRDPPPVRETAKETGALLLAVGGLAAAFGAASCCAIPGLLGGLGLSSAWLTGIAIFTAPHRIALVAAAVISLVGAGAVLAWYRRALACAPDRACGKSAVTSLVIGFVSLGAVLTIAGYFFA